MDKEFVICWSVIYKRFKKDGYIARVDELNLSKTKKNQSTCYTMLRKYLVRNVALAKHRSPLCDLKGTLALLEGVAH